MLIWVIWLIPAVFVPGINDIFRKNVTGVAHKLVAESPPVLFPISKLCTMFEFFITFITFYPPSCRYIQSNFQIFNIYSLSSCFYLFLTPYLTASICFSLPNFLLLFVSHSLPFCFYLFLTPYLPASICFLLPTFQLFFSPFLLRLSLTPILLFVSYPPTYLFLTPYLSVVCS